ncbi:MAG: hypothetical protein AAGH15_10050 [Myxococcota bacterium]
MPYRRGASATEADPELLAAMCARYLAGARAYGKTGVSQDEHWLREVEETVGVSDEAKSAMRKEICLFAAALAIEGKQLAYDGNARLEEALRAHLRRHGTP